MSKIYDDPLEVEARLADLDLATEIMVDAVTLGHEAAAATTLHHPKNHAGFVCWSESSKGLRDLLTPRGWVAEDIDGQPLVRNKRGTIAITVSGGDENTGRRGEDPKTRSAKGPVTLNAVASNSLWLFPEMAEDENRRIRRLNKRQTWVLLIYRDEINQETRSELSLPVLADSAGKICGWSERIILPAIPYGDEPQGARTRTPDEGDQTGGLHVEIRRKA